MNNFEVIAENTEEMVMDKDEIVKRNVVENPMKGYWMFPRIIWIAYLAILLVWIVDNEGGFGWTANNVFGWHALFMSLFTIILNSETIIAYTIPFFPFVERYNQK